MVDIFINAFERKNIIYNSYFIRSHKITFSMIDSGITYFTNVSLSLYFGFGHSPRVGPLSGVAGARRCRFLSVGTCGSLFDVDVLRW